ncbi:Rv3654c family TadE-like protein [Corynebacterium sp. AOP12-C2-36]|uniref:Rv3654c family TadE-like protein n=1 Tax=Corynebacterium sp. AOP12-C2-36 TaxID=3457723 RepID=UPI00403428E1
MNRRAGDDEGSATVVGAALILGVVALSLLIVHGVTGLVQGHRASAAADLTALSAATVLQRAGIDEACSVARTVARGNGAEVRACTVVDGAATPYGTAGLQGVRVEVAVSRSVAQASGGPVG